MVETRGVGYAIATRGNPEVLLRRRAGPGDQPVWQAAILRVHAGDTPLDSPVPPLSDGDWGRDIQPQGDVHTVGH